MRVGLIGAGEVIGYGHVPGVRAGGGEVWAVTDLDADRAAAAAARHGIKRVTATTAELLADATIEVVAICTPSAAHESLAMAALEAGKHVYLEKPPTTGSAAMRRVAERARARRRLLIAGSHHPWRENAATLRGWIERGRLGEVYAIEARKMRHGPLPTGPADGDALDGAMAHSAVHRLDLALFFLDLPTPRRVVATTYHHFANARAQADGLDLAVHGPRADDTVFAQIEFDGGCTLVLRDMSDAHVAQGHVMHWPFGAFDVFGTKGSASLHPLRLRWRDGDGVVHTEQPDVDNDIGTSHGPAYRSMFERIRAGDHDDRDARRAVGVWELLEAMDASARSLRAGQG
jgi:predicted dehydrogenase